MIDMSEYGTHLDGSEDEEDLFEDGGGLELELDNCINTEAMSSFLIMIERNKTWASFFALEYHRKNPKDNRLSKIIKTRSHYLQEKPTKVEELTGDKCTYDNEDPSSQ